MTRKYEPIYRGTNQYAYDRAISSLPIVGPWYSKLAKINRILATPCSPTPMVWVEAFFTALPRMIYTFTKPFLLADQFHGRRPGPRKKIKGIAKLVYEALPKWKPIPGLAWTAFELAAEIALKVEWYLFIIDRTVEFLVHWVSMAYAYQGCRAEGQKGQRFNASQHDYGIATTGANYIEQGVGSSWGGMPPASFAVQVLAGYTAAVHCGGQISPSSKYEREPLDNGTLILRNLSTGNDVQVHTFTNLQDGEQFHFMYEISIGTHEPAQTYVMVITGDVGKGYSVDGYLESYMFGTGEKGLWFDP